MDAESILKGLNGDQRMAVLHDHKQNGALLILAGAGSGEFSQAWAKVLERIDIPVVIASRTHHGLVTLNETLAPGCICAGRLAPQKAAVLLK